MPGVQKNRADLITDTAARIYQNSIGAVTGANTQQELLDFIASLLNLVDDKLLLNLRSYVTTRPYEAGECCERALIIYKAVNPTSGVFVPGDWVALGSQSFLPRMTKAAWAALASGSPGVSWFGVRTEDEALIRWNVSIQDWTER